MEKRHGIVHLVNLEISKRYLVLVVRYSQFAAPVAEKLHRIKGYMYLFIFAAADAEKRHRFKRLVI